MIQIFETQENSLFQMVSQDLKEVVVKENEAHCLHLNPPVFLVYLL